MAPAKAPKRPRDTNQLAKLVIDIASGEAGEVEPPLMSAVKGGHARAKILTPMQRAEIAQAAAHARWKKTES